MLPLVPQKKSVAFSDLEDLNTGDEDDTPTEDDQHPSSEGDTPSSEGDHEVPDEDRDVTQSNNDDEMFWDCGNNPNPGSLRLFSSMSHDVDNHSFVINDPFPEEAIELESAFETLENANFGMHTLQVKDHAGPPRTLIQGLNSTTHKQ